MCVIVYAKVIGFILFNVLMTMSSGTLCLSILLLRLNRDFLMRDGLFTNIVTSCTFVVNTFVYYQGLVLIIL